MFRYLKGTTDLGITFRPVQLLTLEGWFSDADWASSLDDRKSMSGFYVSLGPNLITWSDKKRTAIARSSNSALASTATELAWIQPMF